jgi:Fic family protein
MELVVAFGVGLLASGCVGLVIYLRQRHEAKEQEARMMRLLMEIGKSVQNGRSAIEGSRADLSALARDVTEMRSHISAAVDQGEAREALNFAAQYADAAENQADRSLTVVLNHLSSTDSLTASAVLALHAKMYPKGHPGAGHLRSVQTWIGPPGSTPKTASYVPPEPSRVSPLLDALFARWNSSYPRLKIAPDTEKWAAIAEFYHEFVRIHPFLDGNGRTAWLLFAAQVRDLIGAKVALPREPETTAALYAALVKANAGDRAGLTEVLRGLVLDGKR